MNQSQLLLEFSINCFLVSKAAYDERSCMNHPNIYKVQNPISNFHNKKMLSSTGFEPTNTIF